VHLLLAVACRLARKLRVAAGARRFSGREEGAELIEYALLVGLIALVCLGAIALLGDDIGSLLSQIASPAEDVAPDDSATGSKGKGKGKGKGLGLFQKGRAPVRTEQPLWAAAVERSHAAPHCSTSPLGLHSRPVVHG
jgi:pilus assembly protein Flp/PilA